MRDYQTLHLDIIKVKEQHLCCSICQPHLDLQK